MQTVNESIPPKPPNSSASPVESTAANAVIGAKNLLFRILSNSPSSHLAAPTAATAAI